MTNINTYTKFLDVFINKKCKKIHDKLFFLLSRIYIIRLSSGKCVLRQYFIVHCWLKCMSVLATSIAKKFNNVYLNS